MTKSLHMKITQAGMLGYNGPLGVYNFTDGVSDEPINKFERDRLSASVQCVDIDDDGEETVSGVAERLVAEGKARAPVKETFSVQTQEDKLAEELAEARKTLGVVSRIYTEIELDEVINKDGISGLRKIAEPWNVKNRSIPALREMILEAQGKHVETDGSRRAKIESAIEKTRNQNKMKQSESEIAEAKAKVDQAHAAKIAAEKLTADNAKLLAIEEANAVEKATKNEIKEAAKTGDLAPALNGEEVK